MANEQLFKFAEELKNAREEKGLSLKDLHAQTRIDVKYLEALENGNYSVLPEVYIRAFIREYAAEVDLDVDEMLRKYELAKSGVNFDEEKTEDDKTTDAVKEENSRKTDFGEERVEANETHGKKQNLTPIYFLAGAVLLVAILYFVFTGGDNDKIIVENKYEPPRTEQAAARVEKNSSREEKIVKPAPKTETVEASAPTKKNTVASVTETPERVIPQNPFSLKLTGTDTVWVRAQIDEERTEEFMLYPEISRTIEAGGIVNLLIGNSAGVEIYVDGNKIEFEGEKGKVKNLVLTKDGIKR